MKFNTMTSLLIAGAIVLTAMPAVAGEVEITFTNSLDKSEQKAAAYIPTKIDKDSKPRPLLVIAHYWSGNRYTAKRQGYYEECEKRNWLLVCPDLHGKNTSGKTSMAALEAQHDVIDAIEYMKANYKVDASRIYIAGRSMGGMLSQMMAAKYPDVFAAIMSGQGISDMETWIKRSKLRISGPVRTEFGAYEKNPFEYRRRSSVNYASNMQYVPIFFWHGTNDRGVPPEQTETIHAKIKKHNRFILPVNWMVGAEHNAQNFTVEWVCDQLKLYQMKCDSLKRTPMRFFPKLEIVTDEDKSYFWLGITRKESGKFARVTAEIRDEKLTISAENTKKVLIDLTKVPPNISFAKFEFKSDTPMELVIKNGDWESKPASPAKEAMGAVTLPKRERPRKKQPARPINKTRKKISEPERNQ